MRKISLLLLVGSFCVTNQVWSDGSMTSLGPPHPTNEPPAAIGPRQAVTTTPAAPAAPVMPSKPLVTAPVPTTHASTPKIESLAQQAAQEEIARRQEAQIAARRLIDQGVKLHSAAKYVDAIAKFEDALKMLPRAKATETDYARAIHGISDSYYRLAAAAEKNNEHDKAKQLAQKALEYEPQNGASENLIVRIKAEERRVTEPAPRRREVALDETPAFLEKRNQIKKLFREGKILMGSGQFDEAEKRFQQILLLDPYNDDAHTLLEKLNTARLGFAEQAGDKFRTERLWDVSRGWIPPVATRVEPPKPGPTTPVQAESAALAGTKEKLNKIILPEVALRDATITDVIKFFSAESRRLDEPTKEGINFVLQSDMMGQSNVATRLVSMNLHNIPLIEALRYATSGAGLEFRIEPNAVMVGIGLAQAGQMTTRTYPVSGEAFVNTVTSGTGTSTTPAGGGGGEVARMGGAGSTATMMDVRKFFEDAGLPFPTGSSLVYNERSSMIIIRNTTENLETFERVLASINVVPMQVEVEAKFVEISQVDLDELSFQWQVGRKTAGSFDVGGGSPSGVFPPDSTPSTNPDITQGLRDSSAMGISALDALMSGGASAASAGDIATIRGILTNPQFQVVVKALAQKKSSDILQAPKVTTISGSQAMVKIVQEFIYPNTYSQAQVTSSGGGTSGGVGIGVTPAIPSDFRTREIGVLLTVTPTVGADGYTINLRLVPEVSEFLGFINYGSPISYAVQGAPPVSVPNDIKQPLFQTRTLTTSVVIWDGQTVVLGGLIREQVDKIDDKVPFLGDIPFVGRLFRSKVTSRTKRNLLIFVTANLIDPAGNKIHKQTTDVTAG